MLLKLTTIAIPENDVRFSRTLVQKLPKWRKQDINFKLQEYIHSTQCLASEVSNWRQRKLDEDPNGQTYKWLHTLMSIKENLQTASKRNFHLRTMKKRQKVKEFILPKSFLSWQHKQLSQWKCQVHGATRCFFFQSKTLLNANDSTWFK